MVKTFPFLVEDESYYFDEAAALKVIDFIERFCKLSDPMGEPFILLPWQRQIVLDVFGWKRRDNNERRFVYVYAECPRKNGKTFFLAAILIWLLMAESPGAEVYASACTNEQSGILYKSVLRMIDQSTFFTERLEKVPYKSEVRYAKRGGVLKALSGESVGSHGKYPSAVVFDELHEWTNPKAEALYDALTTGWGNRNSPLAIHITTAGYGSFPTLARRLHDKAVAFGQGKCDDPTFYGVVYGADLEDDWTSEATWQKANPSYNLAEKNLKREFLGAKNDTSKENIFRNRYLNQWTQQQTRWLPMDRYEECTKGMRLADYLTKVDPPDLILGVDLSQIYDLTAIAYIFPEDWGKWRLFVRCYMPAKQIERRTREDGIPYDQWAKAGWLIPTLGASNGVTIDYEQVANDITDIAEQSHLIAVGYDPNGSISVIPQVEQRGINCIPISPKPKDMSDGSKEFHGRISSGMIEIERNPCLKWQAENVEVIADNFGNIRPVKPNAKGKYGGSAKYKVDGIVAAIIATQTALLTYHAPKETEEVEKPQVYFL